MNKGVDFLAEKFSGYPETFGDIPDWAIARTKDPENKILFRMVGTDINISYAEFGRNVNRVCNFLQSKGVKKGDKVAVFLPNCLEYAYLFHALGKCGAVMIPINQFLRNEPIKYILNHSESKVIITNKSMFMDKIHPLISELNELNTLIFVDEAQDIKGLDTSLFADYVHFPSEFQPSEKVSGTDIQGIWYTSGTTGMPKGVVIKHKVYIWRACYFAEYFRLSPETVHYFILPMYHSAYAVLGTPMVMAAGGEIIQVNWFSASKFWPDVEKYRVTLTASTGTIIPILLKQAETPEEARGKEFLKLWIGWPVDDREAVKKRWPQVKFVELYGTTEAPIATITSFDNPELGSCGPPAPYTDLKLVDPQTREQILEKNRVGEIVYAHKLGPDYILDGYYKDPDKTSETLKDGYWYSGDLGLLDEQGNLHFVDRKKDYLRIGGENVSSVQVEGLIRTHPSIEEVAVVGTKGDLGHDEIVAFVVLKKGMSLDPMEFFSFCNDKMSYFMVPRYLVFREEIPKTATMRIEKFKLKEDQLTDAYDRVKLGYNVRR
ncbi:MAG: AMP-binding protein [Bacillota bacterium]